MRHKHHIIPKHRGGTNDPSNLVEISLTQHAMFHYCEWKLHGKRADYVAWKRLVGNWLLVEYWWIVVPVGVILGLLIWYGSQD